MNKKKNTRTNLLENQTSPKSFYLQKRFVGLCGITLVFTYGAIATPFIVPLQVQNGKILFSNYRMKEDRFDHPRLQLLRQREHLDQVVAPGATQFEKIVLLRKWVHNQWPPKSNNFYYPPWDAVEILDLARKNKNYGFCAQYSIVFLQACQSLGLHARYVDLPGHFVTGVWSDDFNRWVIMDPTGDVHYVRDGIPLGGRALTNAFWSKNVTGIFKVSSDGNKTSITKKNISNYQGYSIGIDANQLTQPVTVIVNGQSRVLNHRDDFHLYPEVGRDRVGISSDFLAWENAGVKSFMEGRAQSHDPDDFDYRKNQTSILLGRMEASHARIKVVLKSENSETFGKFVCKLDGNEWQPISVNEIIWELRPGVNTMSARIQTQYNWLGPISQITVFYKPAYFLWRKKSEPELQPYVF